MDERAKDLWKKYKISRAEISYDCGGDSMNDMEVSLYKGKKCLTDETFEGEKEEELRELAKLLEEMVYHRVDFYEVSDSYYMGEHGYVHVKFKDDIFLFEKDSTSEYRESFIKDIHIDITPIQSRILCDYISNMSLANHMDAFIITYKVDCVLSEQEQREMSELEDKLKKVAVDLEITDDKYDGEDIDGIRVNMFGVDGNSIWVKIEKTYITNKSSKVEY